MTNREIPIASRVNDQEYRKLMWAQLVVPGCEIRG
eukprot:SAG31_NODE_36295_length_314_cov_1.409302_1_plen_34_part_10